MPMRSFPNFNLIISRHRKELRGTLGHGLCVNPSLNASNTVSMVKQLNERPRKGSSTTEESAAEIQEQSGVSHSNQQIVRDDLTIIHFY